MYKKFVTYFANSEKEYWEGRGKTLPGIIAKYILMTGEDESMVITDAETGEVLASMNC